MYFDLLVCFTRQQGGGGVYDLYCHQPPGGRCRCFGSLHTVYGLNHMGIHPHEYCSVLLNPGVRCKHWTVTVRPVAIRKGVNGMHEQQRRNDIIYEAAIVYVSGSLNCGTDRQQQKADECIDVTKGKRQEFNLHPSIHPILDHKAHWELYLRISMSRQRPEPLGCGWNISDDTARPLQGLTANKTNTASLNRETEASTDE